MRKKIFTKYDYERLQILLSNNEILSSLDEKNVNMLKRDLQHSKLVDSCRIKPNIVTMNSKICIKNLGNGKKEIYSLAFPQDCTTNDKLNVFSKIGSQLLGSTIGTVITPNPGSDQFLLVEEILYQPEAEGDYHL